MDMIVANVAEGLDRLRSQFLRKTTSAPLLRQAFLSRSQRLALFFLLFLTLGFSSSLLFPLWVLILGPMIYGFPHLFATLRFVPEILGNANRQSLNASQKKILFFVGTSLFALISVLRVLTDNFNMIALNNLNLSVETLGLIAVAVALALWLRPGRIQLLRGSLFLALIIYASLSLPLWLTGALLLIHNFVAFIYWILLAKTSSDRWIAVGATLVFVAINVALFAGIFDGVYKLFTPAAQIAWADMDYASIGRSIAPWSANYKLWFHAVVAYAFGQSLHYFVWLKAIPDLVHKSSVPTSFRQSYALLKRDFGQRYVIAMLLLLLGGAFVWAFMAYPQARLFYFAVASFHGYFELAALAVARAPRS